MHNKKKILEKTLIYLVYVLISLFFISPVLWTLSISLRPLREVYKYPPKLFPSKIIFDNYIRVLHTSLLGRYLMNSLIIVLLTILGTLVLSVPASYVLSRIRHRAKGTIMISILVFQMISPLIIAIPIYGYFEKLHLLNTFTGVIIAYIAIQLPFVTWLMKGYFDTIPLSIEEAAMIDGCSRFQTLRKIILPLSLPGIATATIFTAIQSWGQFIIPFVLLSDSKYFPISLGLYQYQAGKEAITTHLIASASIISIIPVVIGFLILQKFIVKSLTRGAIKG
ncbi:MAG: carbohydrate ABC transporter permease [Kosmotoga sp.]|nr:carbohydrate ABC transporter permease [Kosmotoga sp.]